MNAQQGARRVVVSACLRQYFECISDDGNNLQMLFKLCMPKTKIPSVAKIVNSNLGKPVKVTNILFDISVTIPSPCKLAIPSSSGKSVSSAHSLCFGNSSRELHNGFN